MFVNSQALMENLGIRNMRYFLLIWQINLHTFDGNRYSFTVTIMVLIGQQHAASIARTHTVGKAFET